MHIARLVAESNADPWFILTDLTPPECSVTWYRLRTWCEQGFKCNKRGGWQGQATQMHHPERAPRLWMALAVATLWIITVGTDLECGDNLDDSDLLNLYELLDHKPKRRMRLYRLGRLWILVNALTRQCLHLPHQLLPGPWPTPRSLAIVPFATMSEVST